MASYYGVRYLDVRRFISYCHDVNIKTEERELEHYEKMGLMLPTARVILPEAYRVQAHQWSHGLLSEQPNEERWPELRRLSDRRLVLPADYAGLPDEELIDSFDREFGANQYLVRPSPEAFQPWDSYQVKVPYQGGQILRVARAEHHYSYWQVHQLFLIQAAPDLYENRVLLDHLPADLKERV